jgi:hypothetical protein
MTFDVNMGNFPDVGLSPAATNMERGRKNSFTSARYPGEHGTHR